MDYAPVEIFGESLHRFALKSASAPVFDLLILRLVDFCVLDMSESSTNHPHSFSPPGKFYGHHLLWKQRNNKAPFSSRNFLTISKIQNMKIFDVF